jgi:hypothetical protein
MMGTLPPVPQFRPSGLKATTRVLLQGHARRARAIAPDEAMAVTLTPYSPSVHGASFLLHVWLAAVQTQEHIRVFGPSAEMIEAFVRLYTTVELVVLHRADDADWMHGQSWLGLAFFDDVDGQARARLHHFVQAPYRTPRMTQGLASLVLTYAFQTRGFQALYGLTPVAHRDALRFAYRLGFTKTQVKPMTIAGEIVEGMETVLRRERWAARRLVEEG